MSQFPRTFSHIGLSVPNVDEAVKFYSEVLGFYVIMTPTDVVEDDSDIGVMCTDVFGPDWKKLRIAHLATADRIGIELLSLTGITRPKTTSISAEMERFTFAFRTLTSKVWSKRLCKPVENSGCRSGTIIPEKSHTAWSMLKTHLVSYSNSTATRMS